MATDGAPSRPTRHDAFPFALTVALTAWFAVSIWSGNRYEFAEKEIPVLVAYGFAVLALQATVYFLAFGFLQSRKRLRRLVLAAVNAAFLVFNFYTIVVVHSARVESQDLSTRLVLVAVLLGGAFMLSRFLPARAFVVFGAMALGHAAYTAVDARLADEAGDSTTAGQELPKPLRIPRFTTPRNVYLISLDSLVPEVMAERFLGADEMAYVTALREGNARLLTNVFSEGDNTNNSLNSMLALDMDWWRKLPYPDSIHLETGRRNSPVYEIFRRNGYRIQFLYSSGYFGPKRLANVDFYGTADVGICHHISNRAAFLGYCSDALDDWRDARLGTRAYPEFLFSRMKIAADSDAPWLTMAHIWMPGHTAGYYSAGDPEDLEEFKAYYLERSELAAEYVRSMLALLRERDPDAVLLLYGDHGMWVTRGLESERLPPDSPYTKTYLLHDRHAVLAALYPSDFCPDFTGAPIGLPLVMRRVIACLSDGRDPLGGLPAPAKRRFAPFAYDFGQASTGQRPLP